MKKDLVKELIGQEIDVFRENFAFLGNDYALTEAFQDITGDSSLEVVGNQLIPLPTCTQLNVEFNNKAILIFDIIGEGATYFTLKLNEEENR